MSMCGLYKTVGDIKLYTSLSDIVCSQRKTVRKAQTRSRRLEFDSFVWDHWHTWTAHGCMYLPVLNTANHSGQRLTSASAADQSCPAGERRDLKENTCRVKLRARGVQLLQHDISAVMMRNGFSLFRTAMWHVETGNDWFIDECAADV